MAAIAKRLDALTAESADQTRFAILRNITIEPGLPAALKIEAARAGLCASVYVGDFDNVAGDVFDSASALYAQPRDIVVIALRLQALAPRLVTEYAGLAESVIGQLTLGVFERVMSFVRAIRAQGSATVLVHNFELPVAPAYGILDAQVPHGQRGAIRALNARLAASLAEVGGCYVVDIDDLLSQIGYENGLDDRYWHIGRAPYSFALQCRVAAEYVKFARALKGKTKKCLVLDCDNTLWGGVVGEDGPSGIRLGASYSGSAYVEFQAAILDLYHRGILLALNSKNNFADAMEVFEKHPSSVLKPAHFVSAQINWLDKITNLRTIATELNIGLDSLVFVDDNPFECQFVREGLPDVEVVELPRDPTRYARLLRSLPFFETLARSSEDRRRSEMYRSNAQRAELRQSTTSMDEYLRSLEMQLTISPGDDFSLPRIAQLTQKTNQFNLTTRRYSEADIKSFIDDAAWNVYYAHLSDKFDDAGIIAVALVEDRGKETRIDSFLMSCRVIGRGVEEALLAAIARDSRERGQNSLDGEFVPTAKNALAADFFQNRNFEERPGTDRRWWRYDLTRALPLEPSWFRRTGAEANDESR